MIAVEIDVKQFEFIRKPMRLISELQQRPIQVCIENPYMEDFGWYLEYGTGIYGQRRRRITIRPVNKKILRWPERDAFGKQVMDEHGKPAWVYRPISHPKGIKPMRIIQGALSGVPASFTHAVQAAVNTSPETASRALLAATVLVEANKVASRLRARSGAISKRLARSYVVRSM